jgi:hypothetical protein
MKKKFLLLAVAITLITAGCSSSNAPSSHGGDRFMCIDSSGSHGNIYVDTVTNIEYFDNRGYSLCVLLDKDGTPLKYNAKTGK